MGVSAYFKKEHMKVLQNFETFANIVSMALGGKKDKKKADRVIDIQSADQLDTLIRRQMNGSK
jgi:hypothetical protein